MTYGWAGTVGGMIATEPHIIVAGLAARHAEFQDEAPGAHQRSAWIHQVECLRRTLSAMPDAADWGVVMEYYLPFEGGRRADTILLSGDRVLALEFKDAPVPTLAFEEQARAYARDLADYHSACAGRTVLPLLALPSAADLLRALNGGRTSSCDRLGQALTEVKGAPPPLSVDEFTTGRYEPLPTLIDAARRVFRNEPLPHIRRAESAGIPELLRWLHDLVARAQREGSRHLVLIAGVPGSGKTLVGLQFVHELELALGQGIFLSGNGPLVQVLQAALKSKAFVRPMRAYITDYGVKGKPPPAFHVLVFDEAQRAWDVEYVREKHHGFDRSEPEMIMRVAASLPGWSVVIGLVGEGQEIYRGEESGIAQWRDAVRASGAPTAVHVPAHLAQNFAEFAPDIRGDLNLTLSLRTHRAVHAQRWLTALIDGKLDEAGALARPLEADEYGLFFTDDLARAGRFIRSRFVEEPLKRFGLVASARAKNLVELGIDNAFRSVQRVDIAAWFNADPEDPRSSCQLLLPVTEFQCQGLELDMPLLCWGDDLGWEGRWMEYRRRRNVRNSYQLLLNAYRVLLSRGREGVVVYLPRNLREGQPERLTEVLTTAGFRRLPETE